MSIILDIVVLLFKLVGRLLGFGLVATKVTLQGANKAIAKDGPIAKACVHVKNAYEKSKVEAAAVAPTTPTTPPQQPNSVPKKNTVVIDDQIPF